MTRSNDKPRDAAITRARILDRAAEVFAEKGFEGASISDLTEACEVNRRMIYHYFGDKEGLYRAIFVRAWEAMRAAFVEALAAPGDEGRAPGAIHAQEALLRPLGAFFDFLVERPAFVRLMAWEALEGGRISKSIWKDLRAPVFRELEALVRAAKASGAVDPAIDPAHLVISLMGATTFYFAYAPTLEQVFGRKPLGKAALAERRAQTLALARALLLRR
jgi:TetR/AcrR family transcriptional regulator